VFFIIGTKKGLAGYNSGSKISQCKGDGKERVNNQGGSMFLRKRWVMIVVICILLAGMTACTQSKGRDEGKPVSGHQQTMKMAYISMEEGGIRDSEDQVKKAGKVQGFDVAFKKVSNEVDQNEVSSLVNQGYHLILTEGKALQPAVERSAEQYPDAKLVAVGQQIDRINVESIDFVREQTAYLAGVAAGLGSLTNQIAFVGTADPEGHFLELSFEAGVKAVKPDAKISAELLDKKADIQTGRSTASSLYRSGVDIITHMGGSAGAGIESEALARVRSGEKLWVIGSQSGSEEASSEVQLASMDVHLDKAVSSVMQEVREGKFHGGRHKVFGLKEGGVSLTGYRKKLREQDAQQIESYANRLITAEIALPVMQ